jgi:hypothetical protein
MEDTQLFVIPSVMYKQLMGKLCAAYPAYCLALLALRFRHRFVLPRLQISPVFGR